jgi:hypothetical protein
LFGGTVIQNRPIEQIYRYLNGSIPELHAPFVTGSLVKKQPTSINEQLRFATTLNGWQDYYNILSGGVMNNENVQVIQIKNSTLSTIKQIIQDKYGNIDDTSTYKITGEIELIPTPITCGFMSGLTPTVTVKTDLPIISGEITGLQISESRYNKNVKYIDLDNNKTVNLNLDPYYGYYCRNCYNRALSSNNYQ